MGGRYRFATAALALVVVAGGIGGCGGGTPRRATPGPASTSTTTTVPPPQPASLDMAAALTLAVGSEPTNWNQLSSAGAQSDPTVITDQVLPSVFTIQPDYSLALDRNVVTSATQTSASPQTVVYQINPKATWSDGVPITGSDFQYNWMAQSGQSRFSDVGGHSFTPASTVGYQDIASVTDPVGDPDTVTVTFSTPFVDWPSLFADMVPAHIASKVGFDTGFTDPVDDVVSGGPFLIESYVAGQSVTLVRNAKWWGSPASLSSVTFDFVGQPSIAATALGLGEVGALSLAPTAALLTTIDSLSAVRVNLAPGPDWEELAFNPTGPSGPGTPASSPWMKDPALRQALMLAVDRTQLIAGTVGVYAPSTTPLDNRFFVPQEPAYADNSGGRYTHANLSGAKTMLAQAGYALTGGVLTKAGRAVTLRLATSTTALDTALAQGIVAAIGQLGITVSVVPVSAATDLAVVDRTASADLSAEGAGITDMAVATLLARAAAATDRITRDRLYNQIDVQLWQGAESLPLFQIPTLLVYQQRYVGVVANPSPGGPTWDLSAWGVQDQS